jgi:alkanesulfonate monooxygenase SsuD/methylene tetrahydromethanopterin reductase-like flavin-dependent oxidoreductase (luciferase family)
MTRTVITLAVRFWLARHIYINQDKKEARKKEAQIKQKLSNFLMQNGLTKTELRNTINEIM